jgi:hypothetical protein
MRRLSLGLQSAVKTAKKSDMKVTMSSSILASPMVRSALRNNNILGSPMLKSALRNSGVKGKVYSRTPKESMKQVGIQDDNNDLADRLLGGDPNENNYHKDEEENQPISKNWRRRSWSVRVQLDTELVDGLSEDNDENTSSNSNIDDNIDNDTVSPDKKRSTVITSNEKPKLQRGRRGVGQQPSVLFNLGAK